MTDYASFLDKKQQLGGNFGFEPTFLPPILFDFQRHLVEWAVRRGRAAIFADCGMGKSLLELVIAENIVRHTNSRVLILTPLAVASQFVSEGAKFGIEVTHSKDGTVGGSGIYVSNYERLHKFDRNAFAALLGDESSGIKDMDGKRTAEVIEFMRTLRYRGLYTATAAPNDFDELGTSSEALGELGYQDMLSKFFKKETKKDFLGWGRTKHKLRKYAERDYWRWVCSWARACRKPSDLGFDDARFKLPPLTMREHVVATRSPRPGYLFDGGSRTLQEQQEEQRRTLPERCEKVAELVNGTGQPAICWCHLNDEGDALEKLIPDSVQVSGRDDDDEKEEKLTAFAKGKFRVLVSKQSIAGFGLNFQHCAHQTYFPSDSFERWYQGIRRSWRFGQTREVVCDVITTDGGAGTLANLKRKQVQAEEMFSQLVALMNEGLIVERTKYGTQTPTVPSWL